MGLQWLSGVTQHSIAMYTRACCHDLINLLSWSSLQLSEWSCNNHCSVCLTYLTLSSSLILLL